jgi:hypothetical protein
VKCHMTFIWKLPYGEAGKHPYGRYMRPVSSATRHPHGSLCQYKRLKHYPPVRFKSKFKRNKDFILFLTLQSQPLKRTLWKTSRFLSLVPYSTEFFLTYFGPGPECTSQDLKLQVLRQFNEQFCVSYSIRPLTVEVRK